MILWEVLQKIKHVTQVFDTRKGGTDRNRGTSSAVGTVLLVGLITLTAGALLASGTITIGDAEDNFEQDAFESDLEEIATQLEPVAFGDNKQTEIEFDIASEVSNTNPFVANTSTGSISVEIGGTTIYEDSLSSIEFSHSGNTFAFQSGGILRKHRENEKVVASPSLSFSDVQEPTYTFQLVQVENNATLSGSTVVTHNDSENLYENRYVAPADEVHIEIETQFLTSWERTLSETYDLSDSQITVNPSQNRIIAEFGSGEELFFHLTRYEILLHE